MTTIDKTTAVNVLTVVAYGGSAIATHWMNKAVPPLRATPHSPTKDTARTRRFMIKLSDLGLVEGVRGRNGDVRWWKITDAGRTWLERNL